MLEHAVPSGAFTFAVPIRSKGGVSESTPDPGPWATRLVDALEHKREASGREDHTMNAGAGKGNDKTTKKPELQGGVFSTVIKEIVSTPRACGADRRFHFQFPDTQQELSDRIYIRYRTWRDSCD